jgi:beta-glucosidase
MRLFNLLSFARVRLGLQFGVLLLTFGIAVSAGAPAQTTQGSGSSQPWMNKVLTPDARADLLQAEMTQDEALQLVIGYMGSTLRFPFAKPAPEALRPLLPGTAGFVPGISRLGIPGLAETDAGVGIANGLQMRPGDTATAFPSGLAGVATWNPQLSFDEGQAIAQEARDRAFNVVLDGAINLAREPRGGRTFEYAGEDPLLAGSIVGEEIRGIQSRNVISTIKHFALNDQENGRGILSANIDEAAARESDLLAFQMAIEHGDPGAVMCAYNRYNSVYACENDFLLNRVLKRDWAYTGWVLSDWGAVHSTADAANAGLDQESSSGFDRKEYFGQLLKDALATGQVPSARLHDMVHRILRSMFAHGLFDDPPEKANPTDHIAQAQQSAAEAIVLLKNDTGMLPLSDKIPSIAVIGAHADIGMLSGGGSSQVAPIGSVAANDEFPVGGGVRILPNGARIMPLSKEFYDPPSPLSALTKRARLARVRYSDGTDVDAAVRLARQSSVAIVFVQQWMTEGVDVPDLSLPGAQNTLIESVAAANPRTIVVLETGGPVLMPWLDKVPAVVEAWYAGSGGAPALAQVLFGDIDPSGRLPITFPGSEDQLPRPNLISPDASYRPFDVSFPEGSDVGYRWFERKSLKPLFPFGFGLSYTSFRIDALEASGGMTATASANVTNTGPREGHETVEFYASPTVNGMAVAPRLIGWSKVELKPGETRRVTITADPRLLAHFDATDGKWHVDAGNCILLAGASVSEIAAQTTLVLSEQAIKP